MQVRNSRTIDASSVAAFVALVVDAGTVRVLRIPQCLQV